MPLAGAKVFLRNGDAVQTAVSGADGRFAFEGIAPGRYGLHAELAPWEGLYGADFTVAERGCAERASVTASTDQAGVFQLRDTPAGEFVVGVNVEAGPRPESRWPTTFYPGVGGARLARVLRLEPNGKVEGISFSLPTPMVTRTITVRVLWADGREVGGSALAWAERVEPPVGSYLSGTAASKSDVWLSVMRAYSYRISAGGYVRGPRTIGSEPLILAPGSEPVKLEIRLRENRPSQ